MTLKYIPKKDITAYEVSSALQLFAYDCAYGRFMNDAERVELTKKYNIERHFEDIPEPEQQNTGVWGWLSQQPYRLFKWYHSR